MNIVEVARAPFDLAQRIVDREGYRYAHSGAFQQYFMRDGQPKKKLIETANMLRDAACDVLGPREVLGLHVVGGCAHWMFGKPNDNSDLDILVVTHSLLPREDGPQALALLATVNPHLPTADIANFKQTGHLSLKGPDFVDVRIAPYPLFVGRFFDLDDGK